jgi:hypothetical protein
MRLHRYEAADRHRLGLMLNRVGEDHRLIGIAAQRGKRVWSLVWRGPASMTDEKRWAREHEREHARRERLRQRGICWRHEGLLMDCACEARTNPRPEPPSTLQRYDGDADA